MKLKSTHYIGLGIALVIFIVSLILRDTKGFYFLIGLGFFSGAFPFVANVVYESKVNSEKEEMFLEFSRNLVESVKTGTPISKSIINMKNKPYGVLSENVKKLANQISLGIPLTSALKIFAKDVGNKTVSRALTLIGQAEKAGGDIGEILESVTEAVSLSDKLKKERKASIQTLVAQGYIIFFVFIVIVLVMQYVILPMISGMDSSTLGGGAGLGVSGLSFGGGGGSEGDLAADQGELAAAFLYLLMVQGLFTGLTIGKLSEGNAKSGIKHSFALMISSFLISSGANIIWGA